MDFGKWITNLFVSALVPHITVCAGWQKCDALQPLFYAGLRSFYWGGSVPDNKLYSGSLSDSELLPGIVGCNTPLSLTAELLIFSIIVQMSFPRKWESSYSKLLYF